MLRLLVTALRFTYYMFTKKAKKKLYITYFISPQIWAWNPGRIKNIKRYVDMMLVIFPFEPDWYKQRGVNTTLHMQAYKIEGEK